jgi:hypothetical protein
MASVDFGLNGRSFLFLMPSFALAEVTDDERLLEQRLCFDNPFHTSKLFLT